MSTDKLRALHNTVAEILKEPPSPPIPSDEKPQEQSSQLDDPIAKAYESLRRATENSDEHFRKATAGEATSAGIAPQALAKQSTFSSREIPRFSGLSADTERSRLNQHNAGTDTVSPADLDRTSPAKWAFRGLGVLMAAGVGVTGISWLMSSDEAPKTATSSSAALVQTAQPELSELTSLLQSMARDLAALGKDVEQLKVGREQLTRENPNLFEQLKTGQEQLARTVAQLSEQLRASQAQVVQDGANATSQYKAIQEQLIALISRASELSSPHFAETPRHPLPLARAAAPAASRPAPTTPPGQPAARPRVASPRPALTASPVAPPR